ncbi:MAG TPA: DegQ family serine endoprotease [Vicinamibacterales bacterium]
MSNGFYRKGAVAALAIGVVTMAAWKAAPQASSYLMAAPAPSISVAAPGIPAAVTSLSYAPIVERVEPAVVTIRVQKRAQMEPADQQIPDDLFRRFFGEQMPRGQQMPRGRMAPRGIERGLGSGVIVTPDGYILTNNHVIDGTDKVEVELPDSRSFSAKVVGTDPATDLAVVKIDATSLPTLTIGDSDAVKVGDQVLAVGNPLAIGETVTAGIISAKGRQTPEGNDGYQDFLQTDAAINHGNSGGALVNMAGQLIGINSQIMSPSDGNIGLGFAIPSNMAKSVMQQLVKGGVVHRAKLGVTIQNVTPDLASSMGLSSSHGALVSSVEEGGPAARAGFKQGDVITQFNGKAVADNNQLRNAVAATTPGTTVAVEVLRNGQTETLHTTLGELAPAKGERVSRSGDNNSEGGKYGMSVQPLTPDLAEQVGVPRGTQGVLVAGVDPDGIAADSQIQEGDVIEKVNGKTVTSVDALRSALDSNNGKPALLLVHRKDATIFLTLKAK